MPTIAIVGAGPQLGAAVARRFARAGFDVGLISRRRQHIEEGIEAVAASGVQVRWFGADIYVDDTVGAALSEIEANLGAIDVLIYSPMPSAEDLTSQPPVDAVNLTAGNVQRALQLFFLGALDAVEVVLPGMLERGRGTILATTGLTSAVPAPVVADLHAAVAALKQWLSYLDLTTADRGVHAVHFGIAAYIGQGRPDSEPDAIAEAIWRAHAEPGSSTVEYVDMPEDGQAQGLAEKVR